MKTLLLALLVGGLSALGLITISPHDISNLSTIVVDPCDACPTEATCVNRVCVLPTDLGNGDVPEDGGATPGEEPGGETDCTKNPNWTDTKGKITICHQTGNKNAPSQTITVSSSALPAHIAHGDVCGVCGEGGIITPPTCLKGEELCKNTCVPIGSC
jgi:hypothetical protein